MVSNCTTLDAHGSSRSARLCAALCALLLPIVAVSDVGLVERLQGYYSAPSRICASSGQGSSKGCQMSDTDCMRIRKIDDGHAKFYVYSVQENGAQCEVEGVAESKGDVLLYKDTDADDSEFGKGFTIAITKGKITFKYLSEPDPRVHQPPFCGAQASMDRVAFSLQGKLPLGSQECGNSNDF